MPEILPYLILISTLLYAIDSADYVYLEGLDLRLLVTDLWPLAAIAAIVVSALRRCFVVVVV